MDSPNDRWYIIVAFLSPFDCAFFLRFGATNVGDIFRRPIKINHYAKHDRFLAARLIIQNLLHFQLIFGQIVSGRFGLRVYSGSIAV